MLFHAEKKYYDLLHEQLFRSISRSLQWFKNYLSVAALAFSFALT